MFTAYIIVTVLTAAANTYAAVVDFRRPQWVVDNITAWGGRDSWLLPLGGLKAAGALGLLACIGVPLIGVAAVVGLVLFFVGAIAVVIRARCYSHLSMADDLSFAGCGVTGLATCRVVKDVRQPPLLVDGRENFLDMSKHVSAKHHHYEGTKFFGPITNKNEIELGGAK